jgi:hypothetical protein
MTCWQCRRDQQAAGIWELLNRHLLGLLGNDIRCIQISFAANAGNERRAMEDERFSIKVNYYGNASYAALAPVLDELESEFGSIDFQVSRPDPEFRGGGPFPITLGLTLDIATVTDIIKVAAGLYGAAFLAELGKQDAKSLRQKLLRIPVLNRGPRQDLSHFPLSIMVGTVQFYIDSPMTEEELAFAMQKAAELVAKMRDGRVNNPSGASGWPIGWNPASRSWMDPLDP